MRESSFNRELDVIISGSDRRRRAEQDHGVNTPEGLIHTDRSDITSNLRGRSGEDQEESFVAQKNQELGLAENPSDNVGPMINALKEAHHEGR